MGASEGRNVAGAGRGCTRQAGGQGHPCYALRMTLTIQFDRETDGRWIADVRELPGVLVYGATRDDALGAAQALALHALADRIEHGEKSPEPQG